ncbi:hypothetical protein JB92DRAFT_3104726 [Gautieria morchelliformis]|nr:hypothetical protein JB92DRAFT_3104726 [Gautieria morchelliformis]
MPAPPLLPLSLPPAPLASFLPLQPLIFTIFHRISQMLHPHGASRPQGSRKVSSPSHGSTLALEHHAKIENLHGDNQSLKYRLEQAYLHFQLAEAQKSAGKAHATIRALDTAGI